MSRLIIFIIIVFVISRLINRTRQRIIQAQRQTQQRPKPEVIVMPEPPTIHVRKRNETEDITDKNEEYDESRILVQKSIESDEEDSIRLTEQIVAQKAQGDLPHKRKPIKIAGLPINAKTISQGIVISEILKRPEF